MLWSIPVALLALSVFFIIPFVIETKAENKKDKEDDDA